jgi:putative Mg2+ transporter-C (MgtC) family protein
MVASGACLFMIVSAFGFVDVRGIPAVVLDPSRVAAQVVSGIGFLGAGTIIVQREIVKGLTTAASVWAVAAVGLAVGGGLYLAAACATVLMLVILVVVKHVEPLLHPRRQGPIGIVVTRELTTFPAIRAAVEQCGVQVDRVAIQPSQSSVDDHMQIWLVGGRSQDYGNAAEALRGVPGVQSIEAPIST